ncbi:MAG: DUF1893 domain-containing protein [Candidatus Bathyarchaeales archaeon]
MLTKQHDEKSYGALDTVQMEEDLEIAKRRLCTENLTLSIVKGSKVIFESKTHGIFSFLEAIERFGEGLKGASVADKVVGKAIALLCIYAGVKAVYAETLSRKAKPVFEKHKVHFEFGNLVEKILDASKKAMCPFEKAALKISKPEEAYRKFKALYEL